MFSQPHAGVSKQMRLLKLSAKRNGKPRLDLNDVVSVDCCAHKVCSLHFLVAWPARWSKVGEPASPRCQDVSISSLLGPARRFAAAASGLVSAEVVSKLSLRENGAFCLGRPTMGTSQMASVLS